MRSAPRSLLSALAIAGHLVLAVAALVVLVASPLSAASNSVSIVATDPNATETGPSAGTFTITRSGPTTAALPVNYAIGGSATNGVDYVTLSGTVTILAGAATATVTVMPIADSITEGNESVILTLAADPGYDIGAPASDTVTIYDAGVPAGGIFQFASATYSIAEGGLLTVTITRSGGTWWPASVDVLSNDASATAGADYSAVATTVNFADGQSSNTFTVQTAADALVEGDETFTLALSHPQPSGSSINPVVGTVGTTTVTIVDNVTSTFQMAVAAVTASEGDGVVTITVNRGGSTAGTVAVNVATADGTAHAPGDYTAPSGPLSFAPGETSKTFPVTIVDNAVVDGTRTLTITLSSPTASAGAIATLGAQTTTTLTILDNDAAYLHFGAATLSVVENGGSATIVVLRGGDTSATAGVSYATSDGTATAGADYIAASGTLSFAPLATTASFSVTILNDSIAEGDETINLTLSSPTASSGPAVIDAPASAVLTIVDDDAPYLHFSAATYTVTEAAGLATITVQRAGSTTVSASVAYSTSNGTAIAGSDYTAASGTLNFAAGETSKTFTVPITADGIAESDETINLTLSSPTSSAGVAVIDAPATAVLTISANAAGGGGPTPGAPAGGCGGGGLAVLVGLGVMIALRRLR